MKELEDLKEKVNEREEYSTALHEKNVLPLLEKYENELMERVAAFFEEGGFEVKKTDQNSTITAKYKELIFEVAKTFRSISIREGDVMKAHISIRNQSYAGGSMSIPADEFLAEKAKIQHRLNGIEKNIECFSNPEVYYESDGKRYSNLDDLMSEIL